MYGKTATAERLKKQEVGEARRMARVGAGWDAVYERLQNAAVFRFGFLNRLLADFGSLGRSSRCE
jgi:hypothetical protein